MEDSNRKCTSVKQLELLSDFLENHTDLAIGKHRNKEGRATAQSLWAKCALILNRAGPSRTAKEWAKYWNDLKARTRTKIKQMQFEKGDHNLDLTPIEARISCIIASEGDSGQKDSIFDHKLIETEEVDASFLDVPVTSRKKKIRRHSSDDDVPLKRKMEPIEGLEKACKFLNELQDLDIHSLVNDMDEFQYFGLNIAAQLRKLPLERALRLQLDIQNMIANERIDHLNDSSKNNINVLPERNINPGI